MRRTISSTLFLAGLATVALFVLRSVFPGRQDLELDIYVLVVGALAVLTAVLAAQRAIPVSTSSAIAEAMEREPAEALRPPDLERAERLVTMAATTAFDLHYRLRPILREVAEQRLADRRGIRLDDGPEAGEALGRDLWEVLRPDREPPGKRFAPGFEPEKLRAAIVRLESL
jgi:hypothetical protein